MTGPVIILEFNELTPSLMDRFIAQGELPGFERLRSESIECITDADESPPALEPWIQWVSVHTGLSYEKHQIFELDSAHKLDVPRIWDLVADEDGRAWVCGSMNAAVRSRKPQNLHVLPDPWSSNVHPLPEGVYDPYVHLVRTYVQEYTRSSVPLGAADYLRFMAFMAQNGLSAKTVLEAVGQLASERTGAFRWRRATILDRLQWDLFKHVYRKTEPTLATFFLNSTAHYQHYYWRNMDPSQFAARDTKEREAEYANAILFGYKKMDEIVQDCLSLAGPQATIILCSALGQQPLVKYDATGGKQIFKIKEIEPFLQFASIEAACTYTPVMAEEFNLTFHSEQDAEDAEKKLKALRAPDGSSLMMVRRENSKLFCGCAVITSQPDDATVTAGNRNSLFRDIFYPVEGVKSGMHHPDGILWIRRPDKTYRKVDRKVSLCEIAPTVLSLCGLDTQHPFDYPPMPEVIGMRPATEPAMSVSA